MSGNIFDILLLSPDTDKVHKPMPDIKYRYYHCVKENNTITYTCRLVTNTQKLVPVHPGLPIHMDRAMLENYLQFPVNITK